MEGRQRPSLFFDDHERFLGTSQVFAHRDRLNLRHEAMVTANRDILAGARVLDIASHDGRWSLAALRSGAAHVTGVESRPDAVEQAGQNLAHYGADPSSYEFVAGDVFDVLAERTFDVDVVLCLGFFYHTYRHTELLSHIRDTAPAHVVMDSTVLRGMRRALVEVRSDSPASPGNATLDPYGYGGQTLTGRPTVPGLRQMLEMYGFDVWFYDWLSLLDEHPGAGHVADYREGWRVTARASDPQSGAVRPADARWQTTEPRTEAPSRGDGWRDRVNAVLARTTGNELTRTSPRGGKR